MNNDFRPNIPPIPPIFRQAFAQDQDGNCDWCGCLWIEDEANERTPYCDDACGCHMNWAG